MAGRRIGAVHWLLGLLAIVAAVICAGVVVWWGSIREALMDPAVPYQTYVAPPGPDYASPRAWALLPGGLAAADPPADVFFVHPTTYSRRQWNAAVVDRRADAVLAKTMIPNYAGPFARVGRVFAPHYRQASLYTLMTLREDAREARAFAYGDVRAAFDHFLAASGNRPIVLVGVEQGGVLAERLAREVIAPDPALRARLAGVYLIETPIAAETYPPDGVGLTPCTTRNQAGCVAAWIGEAYNEGYLTRERLRHAPVWNGDMLENLGARRTLCFNPLLGATTNAQALARANIGAANASGLEWGVRPGFQKHQVGAQCIDGVLQITKPRSPALRRNGNWIARQSVRPFNVFYADIEADAVARVAALKRQAVATAPH